jgi:hypothetical protein
MAGLVPAMTDAVKRCAVQIVIISTGPVIPRKGEH